MQDKRVVITGANSGIGRAKAEALAKRGAKVTMVCRNAEKGEAARAEVEAATGNPNVDLMQCDVSDMDDVRRFGEAWAERDAPIDVLINNAGIYLPERRESAQGYEMMFATNHLGPFLMTHLLMDHLSGARVITVSSVGHFMSGFDVANLQAERGYIGLRQYGLSKLCNILFTSELARRGRSRSITAFCYHPGAVSTGFAQDEVGLFGRAIKLSRFVLRSPERGGRTGVYLATEPGIEGLSGRYFVDEKPRFTSPAAKREENAVALWRESERLAGIQA